MLSVSILEVFRVSRNFLGSALFYVVGYGGLQKSAEAFPVQIRIAENNFLPFDPSKIPQLETRALPDCRVVGAEPNAWRNVDLEHSEL